LQISHVELSKKIDSRNASQKFTVENALNYLF